MGAKIGFILSLSSALGLGLYLYSSGALSKGAGAFNTLLPTHSSSSSAGTGVFHVILNIISIVLLELSWILRFQSAHRAIDPAIENNKRVTSVRRQPDPVTGARDQSRRYSCGIYGRATFAVFSYRPPRLRLRGNIILLWDDHARRLRLQFAVDHH